MGSDVGCVACLAALALGVGCASTTSSDASTTPLVMTLNQVDYARAFDEAVEMIAESGMPAELRDRDGGVIESRPNVSGSLLEPWDWPAGSVKAAAESTINHERRRVRFEFLPAGFPSGHGEGIAGVGNDTAKLEGQRTPGATGSGDLANYEGPLELRVWVYIERAYTPYLQRPTWTFRGRSYARNPERNAEREEAGQQGAVLDRSKWTPIGRDPEMERAILESLQSRLGLERS
jgi:hypothetical protein